VNTIFVNQVSIARCTLSSLSCYFLLSNQIPDVIIDIMHQ